MRSRAPATEGSLIAATVGLLADGGWMVPAVSTPWFAQAGPWFGAGLETEIYETPTRTPIAWHHQPFRVIAVHPDGRSWAAGHGRQFEIFRLERDSPDFRGSNLLRAMLRPLRP